MFKFIHTSHHNYEQLCPQNLKMDNGATSCLQCNQGNESQDGRTQRSHIYWGNMELRNLKSHKIKIKTIFYYII